MHYNHYQMIFSIFVKKLVIQQGTYRQAISNKSASAKVFRIAKVRSCQIGQINKQQITLHLQLLEYCFTVTGILFYSYWNMALQLLK